LLTSLVKTSHENFLLPQESLAEEALTGPKRSRVFLLKRTLSSSLLLPLNDPSSALHQINDKNDQSQDQKDVDESPERVRRDHAEEPKDKQNDENCPKHFAPFSQETHV